MNDLGMIDYFCFGSYVVKIDNVQLIRPLSYEGYEILFIGSDKMFQVPIGVGQSLIEFINTHRRSYDGRNPPPYTGETTRLG